MFFIQFASLIKWDHLAPFNFPVDCLDQEALLKHNEQYTFIRCIFVSLDSAHTQKKSFCDISISLFVNNNHVPKITHMVRCIEWNIKSSSYTYHEYTSKYKNNHVEPSILSLHWIFLYSSRYHTTIPPYIQSRSGAFKNTTSIQYTMFFQFTIPTVLKQWKICVKRSKIPFDWAYVIHGHFHMHRINEIPLIYINKNSDIQSYRNEISMPMFP